MALEQNLNLTCRIRSNSNSNFKRPYLGNETTNLISAGSKNFLSSRAFIYSFMKVASHHSFTLFRAEKPLFRGVPGVCRCVSLVRICPWDHFPCRKKKIYLAPHILRCRVNFVISFVEVFSLICTQTAWKPMYIAILLNPYLKPFFRCDSISLHLPCQSKWVINIFRCHAIASRALRACF